MKFANAFMCTIFVSFFDNVFDFRLPSIAQCLRMLQVQLNGHLEPSGVCKKFPFVIIILLKILVSVELTPQCSGLCKILLLSLFCLKFLVLSSDQCHWSEVLSNPVFDPLPLPLIFSRSFLIGKKGAPPLISIYLSSPAEWSS